MALYIELMPIEGRARRTGSGGRSQRAGVADVRRPFRGIEVKEPTHAFFRVVRSDGTPLEMVDSSAKSGMSSTYANFLLQSVQEQRVERQQILETFGAPYVFFFGEAPRFLDIAAVVLDTHDFNWHAEWWENYEKYLRGTRLAERGSTALLHYDDTIIEGYPVQCAASRDAMNQNAVQIQLRMFVTNYMNVSNIGDTNFPIHENAVFAEQASHPESRFEELTDRDEAQMALLAYLQRTAIQNVQLQILRARTIERARALQRQYALRDLGVETEGTNLLSVGKSILQGAVSTIRKDQESGKEAEARLREEMAKALTLAQNGRDAEAKKLLSEGRVGAALNAIQYNPRPSSITLQDALRKMLLYSAPSPAADLTGFLQRLASIGPNNRPLVMEMLAPRRQPTRSKIWHNYDEYTQRGQGEEAMKTLENRTGVDLVDPQEETPDLGRATTNAIKQAGGNPTARNLHNLGLMRPRGKNLAVPIYNQFAKGYNAFFGYIGQKLGARSWPYLPEMKDNQGPFARQWGGTPDVGGSYGGMLGGAPGAGVAGIGFGTNDYYGQGSGLPQGDPWGSPGKGAPPWYTDGYDPTGEEKKPVVSIKYGPTSDLYMGGGAQSESASNKSDASQGKGYFSIIKVQPP